MLENLLKKIIGEYVEEIDPKNLHMGYYQGIIDLKDLNLKKTLFSKLNIPIELVIGKINKLFVKVPW